jgi:hypothetical protein
MAAPGSLAARPADVISRTSADARHRLASATILAAAGCIVAWLIGSRVSYVPMWDGFIYAEAINDAVAAPSLEALRLAGHASQAYAAVAVALQAIAPESAWPLLVLNAALLVAACVGFHRLLTLAFPEPSRSVERALLTAAFALQPSLLATVVQPGLDLPVVPGIIWCTVFMLERRWVATILVGLVTAFTKETAVLLYAVLLTSYGVWTFVRARGPARTRVVAVLRLAPLAIPGIVFGLYLLWRKQSAVAGEPVVWNAGTAMINQSLVRQLLVPRIDRYLASFLAMMGILNFAWIATAFTAAGAVGYARRLVRAGAVRLAARELITGASSVVGFLVLFTGAAVFALTRLATYANSRYVVPIIALVFVLFYASLVTLVRSSRTREAILGAFAVLLLISSVRTVDPVSRALYGTFAVGDRELLRMTSITRECCGAGRDQLVYNLEFTTLERLTSDALESVSAGDSTVIVVPDSTDWYVASRVDRVSHRRTVSRDRAVSPLVIEEDSLRKADSVVTRATFIALPNAGAERGLASLSERYVVGPERRHRRGPYALSVYSLMPRLGADASRSGLQP